MINHLIHKNSNEATNERLSAPLSQDEKFEDEYLSQRQDIERPSRVDLTQPGAVAVAPTRPGVVHVAPIRSGAAAAVDKGCTANNKATKAKKKRKNKYFEDYEKSGRWGEVSRRDILIAIGATLLIFTGIVIAICLIAVKQKEKWENSIPKKVVRPDFTSAPTTYKRPVNTEPIDQLRVILKGMKNITDNRGRQIIRTDYLPDDDIDFYKGINIFWSESELPIVRAMSWVLFEDKADSPADDKWLIPRFALAVMYYSLNGEYWNDDTKWLSVDPVCSWKGLFCDSSKSELVEINLNANNITGKIPSALSLLTNLETISLSKNKLSGTIPATALGSIPTLSSLYLDHNSLIGKVEGTLRDPAPLSTLYVQGNHLKGHWPTSFAPRGVGKGEEATSYLRFIGADCGNSRDELDLRRCKCHQVNSCYICKAQYCRMKTISVIRGEPTQTSVNF